MDLKKFLKASVSNLTWLSEPDTFTPPQKDYNIKDDLEIQWGQADDLEYQDTPAEAAKYHSTDNTTPAIVQRTREWLNQGLMKDDVLAQLKKQFTTTEIDMCMPKLRSLLAKEGLLGCVVIDATGYKDIRLAMKHASKSPYKSHIRAILGWDGEKLMMNKVPEHPNIPMHEVQSSGNTLTDFFDACSKMTTNESKVAYCKDTQLPILAGWDDMDDSWKSKTFIDLMNVGKLTQSEVEEIDSLEVGPVTKMSMAFKWATQKSKIDRYAGKVENDDEKVVSAMEVRVPKAKKITQVDVKEIRLPQQDDFSLQVAGDHIDVDLPTKDLPVKVSSRRTSLDINASAKIVADVKKDNKKKALDVEMGQDLDKEFEGMGDVEVDKKKQAKKDLEIKAQGEFSW